MEPTVEDLVTDFVIDEAWGDADFGANSPKREVIKYSLLKWACGYETGKTAKGILMELGLLNKNGELTKPGKEYLFAAFKHTSQKRFD